jgi:hypothetical protein
MAFAPRRSAAWLRRIVIVSAALAACAQPQGSVPTDLQAGEQHKPVALIPEPASVSWHGSSLLLQRVVAASTSGGLVDPRVVTELTRFAKENLAAFWLTHDALDETGATPIRFARFGDDDPLASASSEAYRIVVSSDGIELTAAAPVGLFRAVTTLRQLARHSGRIPTCTIEDWPAFPVRGFMHDVGRNFQSPGLLRRWIDVLSFYKLNVLHFHLTEYPGWRLESAVHPEITSAASMWPTRKPGDHYTYAELQQLIDYARERHVRLVPEFDLPGHTEALRKATGLTMGDAEMIDVLSDLLGEFCERISAEDVSTIHIGTDEVWHEEEKPHPDLIATITELLQDRGRDVVVWSPGIAPTNSEVITQLWSRGESSTANRYIDSRATYINNMDPFAGVARAFFRQPCGVPRATDRALGGIICLWNDNRITDEVDGFRYNPVLPATLSFAERIWRGAAEHRPQWSAVLPAREDPAFAEFAAFERNLISHRDLWLSSWPFQYVAQTELEWQLSDFVADAAKTDGPPDVDQLPWREDTVTGGTIHLSHPWRYATHLPVPAQGVLGRSWARTQIYSPDERTASFWIGFVGYTRAGGRRGAPHPELGEWSNAGARVWVNGNSIEPPAWLNPGIGQQSMEQPFQDELFYLRDPTRIPLRAGWNDVLLEIPKGPQTQRRLFTFVPVTWDGTHAREATDLRVAAHAESG